jgi:hypothetical protein
MITKTLVPRGVVNPSPSSKTDPEKRIYHDREGFLVFAIIGELVWGRFRLLVLLM